MTTTRCFIWCLPNAMTARTFTPYTGALAAPNAVLTANRADELTRHIRNGAVTITGTADPAATVKYYPTAAKPPVDAERDASGRWVAPNVPMHPMSNGLVRIQFRVDQDGQAPSFRLSEFSVNKVTTAIGNDANGSITNLPSGMGVPPMILTYDCEGNLACVSNAVSGAVSLFWYDQHGRRVAKSEAGLLTLYIWDGMDIIATAHADGTLREYYTRGIGIAGDVGSLIAETRFENNAAVFTTYLHSNWRGDVVMATDASGAVVGAYSYTTFGEQLSSAGSFVPRFTFSSKERDASGLVYHGFRYYCPVLCRWISEDPIRESGGFNLYQFCVNNPVNNIDTDGRKVEVHSRYVQGLKGIGAHTYITVTDSSGKVHTFGSYNRNGWNVARENDPSDLEQNRTSSREIPPPQGMTQQEWDEAVLDAARIRVQELVPQKQEYKWYGGDGLRSGNCHRTTRRIIYDAGGQFPTDYNPPGANPGLESVFP